MPGYILHLTAAKMFLNQMPDAWNHRDEFLVGTLIPDSRKEKIYTHFRNPKYNGNMIEYPDLELFRKKYGHLLTEPACLGYYFHLYIDRKYFKDYFHSRFQLYSSSGACAEKREDVAWVKINRTGETIPRSQFFSDAYMYGDYTKMNTYLIDWFNLPVKAPKRIENPGIEEVDFSQIQSIFDELQGYLTVPKSAVQDLKVFDLEDLLGFLQQNTEAFYQEHFKTLPFSSKL